MSISKLGKLQANITIDDGDRIHYGSNDAIKGRVVLKYRAQSSILRTNATASLFGPLKIHVVLSCKVRIKVRRGDSHRLPTDHSRLVFDHGVEIYNGTFRAELGDDMEYPFVIGFPQDTTRIFKSGGIGSYAELMSKGGSRGLLPLTMATRFMDHPDAMDASVLYRLGIQVTMPGIGVEATVPSLADQPNIQFDLPRPSHAMVEQRSATFVEKGKIQSEYLLPEDQRPQGLKQKAKAVFTSSHFPQFVIDVVCTYPQYIYPGLQLSIEVVLRKNDKESADVAFPEASLESFNVELRAYTIVDVSGRIIGPPQCIDRRTVQSLACQTKMSRQISKAQDYAVSMISEPVLQNVSSFAHSKISRQYLLRFDMRFRLANEVVKIKRECPVIFVPAPTESGANGHSAVAGSSSSYIRPPPDDEQLPTYGEASSSKVPEYV